MSTQAALKMESRNLNYANVKKSLVSQLQTIGTKTSKGLLLGISGGIDSAVVGSLAAETGLPVRLYELPIGRKASSNRAKEQIELLKRKFPNVESAKIDLTDTFNAFEAAQDTSEENSDHLGYVNSRSRLRMMQLYFESGKHNSLVVGTGNKVEDYGIGFFTKYGDGGVDISPIGNLYKSEVYNLGRELGVVDSILEAAPTDDLHPDGATDEDQIGCTYDELERAMVEYDEGKRTSDYIEGSRKREVMEIYTGRHEGNGHKMQMPPVFDFPLD